jgi:hypothetical protein
MSMSDWSLQGFSNLLSVQPQASQAPGAVSTTSVDIHAIGGSGAKVFGCDCSGNKSGLSDVEKIQAQAQFLVDNWGK